MGDQRRTRLSAIGDSGLPNQFSEQQRGSRGDFRRLDDNSVACGQGRKQLPTEQAERRVPWRNRCNHAYRFAQGKGGKSMAWRWYRGSLVRFGQTCEEAAIRG